MEEVATDECAHGPGHIRGQRRLLRYQEEGAPLSWRPSADAVAEGGGQGRTERWQQHGYNDP